MLTQDDITRNEALADISHTAPAPISLDERLREVEAQLIQWALTVSGGNKSRAAKLLQVKRSTLWDRIRRCGLDGRRATAAAPFHDF